MLDRLLVGYGTASGSADALALAHTLASVSGGEVLVVSHSDPTLEAGTVQLPPTERYVRMRAPRFVGGTSRAQALRDHALREGADTIVLGARGAARSSRPGTARWLLDECECALAIAPEGFSARPIRWPSRVGVLLDEAGTALPVAAGIAHRAANELQLLAADPDLIADARDRLEPALAHVWVTDAHLPGASGDLTRSRVADLDLLVVCRHDQGIDDLLGSCHCPVLVAPVGVTADDLDTALVSDPWGSEVV